MPREDELRRIDELEAIIGYCLGRPDKQKLATDALFELTALAREYERDSQKASWLKDELVNSWPTRSRQSCLYRS